VVPAFCDARAPAQLATFDEVLAQRQRERHRLAPSQQQQVRHARCATTLARRRDEHVEPAYRRAAAERERAWDDRLRALRQAAEAAERCAHEPDEPTVTPARRHPLRHLSPCLPALGVRPPLRHPPRQALRRSLMARVMVKRTAADRVEGTRIWASGHCSAGIVIAPVGSQRHVTGDDTMVERTRQVGAAGDAALQMADILRRAGWRAAQRETVLAQTILQRRHRHQWGRPYHQHR
jgi:hypothetical protein